METEIKSSTGNRIVDQVAAINVTGNIIPLVWFKTLCTDNGRPYLLAINILADVVYWYKPTEVRDEGTGELIGFRKKFKADFLQRSYQQISDMFNVSRKQIREALRFLKNIGVVIPHLRDVVTKNGTRLHNVMYLELVPEKLMELTYPHLGEGVLPSGGIPVDTEGNTVVPLTAGGDDSEGNTNTNITTKISTEDYYNLIDETDAVSLYREIIKENIEYEYLVQDVGITGKDNLDEIVEILAEIVGVDREKILIGGVEQPYQLVKSKFLKLNSSHIRYVMDCMKKTTSKINNIRAYLLTALFNAPNTINHYYQAEVNHDLYGSY